MATITLNWDEIGSALDAYYVPELALILMGILAILIVRQYLKNKESQAYNLLVFLGVILGAVMLFLTVSYREGWATYTLIIVAIASFAMIIRPFREVHFSALFGLMTAAIVYIYLGSVTGDFEILATGYPRIILAFISGAFVFMLLNFLEQLVQFFGKLLNAWPILLILGLICIAEAVAVLLGYGSIINLLSDLYAEANMTNSWVNL
ncbi:MAG: hypothetical protein GX137_04975 [Thermoplasmatales archaeon]|jgi:hypothetical protein|nr:hypothetical protein [Thermoplasmatales archaeon]